ncbi:MAG TPA: hypothetical protein DCQ98_11520 [Planctomycetaceae bacterium]|nr:hypothetical protein [Planctomycetaceae bacterium]
MRLPIGIRGKGQETGRTEVRRTGRLDARRTTSDTGQRTTRLPIHRPCSLPPPSERSSKGLGRA